MAQVLFITYYWPPSGKASLQWPLKIIKHLPGFGWKPLVLTAEEDTFSEMDETFLKDISPELKVTRAKSYEPFKLYKKITGRSEDATLVASETISTEDKSLAHRLSVWVRMNLFIPDARAGWYFPAVSAGSRLFSKFKIDAIVSIGPPHTAHLVGKKLSVKFRLPHVPIFIDPWVDIAYYKNFKRNKAALSIDNHMEKSVLKNAANIVFVTETMKKDYLEKYPFIQDKSNVLYWGYSEEDFKNVEISERDKNEKVLVHAGNIFSYQNPKKFWQQLKKETDRGNAIRIKFIGTVDPVIKKAISLIGLDNQTEYLGFLPYPEMINKICNADLLLVCATEPRHVPGKLFEYLRAGKPIITFGDGNEEVNKILTEANAGMMFSYDDSGEEFFNRLQEFITKQDTIHKFERESISKEFSSILPNAKNK